MNPAVLYLLKWEKELEIQRAARGPSRRAAEPIEPDSGVEPSARRWEPDRSPEARRRACECP